MKPAAPVTTTLMRAIIESLLMTELTSSQESETKRSGARTNATATVITGGAGFIGQHLARHLGEEKRPLQVIDNQATGRWDDRIEAEFIEKDLRHLSDEDLAEILPKDGILFHLAAAKYNTPGVSLSNLIETNATATARLFRQAALKRMRIIFASSLYANGSYGPHPMRESDPALPSTVYGATKLFGENVLTSLSSPHRATDEQLEFSHCSVRLMFVYGPKQYPGKGYKSVIRKNFERIRRGMPQVINGDGKQTLDYIYIDDVVDLLVKLSELATPPPLINLGSGQPTSVLSLTEEMAKVADVSPAFERAASDHTHGTSRVADTSLLKSYFPDFKPTSLTDGLGATWLSMIEGC